MGSVMKQQIDEFGDVGNVHLAVFVDVASLLLGSG